jgi:hypothetical protein
MTEDYIPIHIPIHKELDWKLKKAISLINSKKPKDAKQTTYTSIINDCIAVGLRESKYAELLEEEYNKS